MAGLLFGTCGIPHSASIPESFVSGIERIKELGLDCIEIKFPQAITTIGPNIVRETAARLGVRVSAHAPYSLNFNAVKRQERMSSEQRLVEIARLASLWGAQSVTFHPAFYLGGSPEKAYKNVRKHLGKALKQLEKEYNRVQIRPETTGKIDQLGTLEETLYLCADMRELAPAVHFAHLFARTGGFNSYPEFTTILQRLQRQLGRAALDDMHIYICGIAYNEYGECEHLNLKDSDFNYCELLKALRDFEARGVVICESPNLEEDALLLKETYDSLCRGEDPCTAPERKEEEPVIVAEPEEEVPVTECKECPEIEWEAQNVPGHKKKEHVIEKEWHKVGCTIPEDVRQAVCVWPAGKEKLTIVTEPTEKEPITATECKGCEELAKEAEALPGHKQTSPITVTEFKEEELISETKYRDEPGIPGCAISKTWSENG